MSPFRSVPKRTGKSTRSGHWPLETWGFSIVFSEETCGGAHENCGFMGPNGGLIKLMGKELADFDGI